MVFRRRGRRKKVKSVRTQKLDARIRKVAKAVIAPVIENNHTYYQNNLTLTDTLVLTDLTANMVAYNPSAVYPARKGLKARMRGMRINYRLLNQDAYNVFRVIIFRWYPNSSSEAPSAANLLRYIPSDFSGAETISPWNEFARTHYKLLYDKRVITGAATYDYPPVSIHSVNLSGKDLGIAEFGAANVNDGENHVFIGFVSDSTAVAHPSVQFTVEAIWEDA